MHLEYKSGNDSSVYSVGAQNMFRDSSNVFSRSIKRPIHAVSGLTVKIGSWDTTMSMMYIARAAREGVAAQENPRGPKILLECQERATVH